MRLIRDVLDNQLTDRNGVKIGKADGIVVALSEAGPPRLVCLETGLVTRARRLHPALGNWLGRWSRTCRIPWRLVRDVGIDIDVDLDARDTPLLDGENRLRRLLKRVPFA